MDILMQPCTADTLSRLVSRPDVLFESENVRKADKCASLLHNAYLPISEGHKQHHFSFGHALTLQARSNQSLRTRVGGFAFVSHH